MFLNGGMKKTEDMGDFQDAGKIAMKNGQEGALSEESRVGKA